MKKLFAVLAGAAVLFLITSCLSENKKYDIPEPAEIIKSMEFTEKGDAEIDFEKDVTKHYEECLKDFAKVEDAYAKAKKLAQNSKEKEDAKADYADDIKYYKENYLKKIESDKKAYKRAKDRAAFMSGSFDRVIDEVKSATGSLMDAANSFKENFDSSDVSSAINSLGKTLGSLDSKELGNAINSYGEVLNGLGSFGNEEVKDVTEAVDGALKSVSGVLESVKAEDVGNFLQGVGNLFNSFTSSDSQK